VSEALRPDSTPTDPDPVIREAQKRFKMCQDWESNARKLWLDDIKFANADSDNGYQWPNAIRRNRDVEEKPCLTINKARQHALQIINDAKKNKPAIKLMATGNGATKESADCLSSLVRYIEYHSKASVAYDTATEFQVTGGIGYLRVATDYTDDNNFDQDIYIRRVSDPLTIFLDPAAKELDKSDMRYAFVFDDIPLDEFEQMYPEYKDYFVTAAALGNEQDWVQHEKVRVAEYFRKVRDEDVMFTHNGQTYRKSELLDPGQHDFVKALDSPTYTERTVVSDKVEYFFIVGHTVVERKSWPGRFIPIVPVIGEETVIEGQLDRKGHIRALKDAQRMYNYWSSSAVEYGALQTKTPWIGAVQAIEGYEEYWRDANRNSTAILPYNAKADDGSDIPPPTRVEPPTPAPVAITGMQVAAQEMQMVSGQYEAQMGAPGNERTGKAIQERQRQGDTATYHYINGLAVAIRHLGVILLDLIPRIYDTKRLLRVQGEDQMSYEMQIDPKQQQSYMQHKAANGQIALRSLNPSVGRYDVQADIGPGWATKREDAFNAFTLILTQAPQLTGLIGDILLQNGDFPGALQASERLRRMVPPQALGEGPSPQEQMMQQQIQNLSQLLTKTIEELAGERLKVKGHAAQKEIDAYEAFTKRLKVITDASIDAYALKDATIQLIHDMSQVDLGDVETSSKAELSQPTTQVPDEQSLIGGTGPQPPVPGAMDKGGQWFLPDPTRLGRDRNIGTVNGAGGGDMSGAALPNQAVGQAMNAPRQAPDGEWYSRAPGGGWQRHPKRNERTRKNPRDR
jgi:hypothetical protein